MKRKYFLFALLLLSFGFLSSTLSAQNQPSEKKYVWFRVNWQGVNFSGYYTEAEARAIFANEPIGLVAQGYDPDRRGGRYDPFFSITLLPSLEVIDAKLFTYNGQLTGMSIYPNIYLHNLN
ncbi:hypothetical protein KTO58_14140 [Chitinophaga pendula]|uniref:hypothetical protein n=1 Tax=Chitinophaga TaxID=79328 RepID=UPI000BAECAE7|nr:MULTISPECIES: hypothetical protein [Chitinophaga]ASZ12117.1 hypothetical protein CK934_14695 [Chitinophaga sp. MD30]UCJ04844.1 hypothetical protein KTO58_14140 [Chitinophaga pendula]